MILDNLINLLYTKEVIIVKGRNHTAMEQDDKLIALFLNDENQNIGGVETHEKYFRRYFGANKALRCIVYRKNLSCLDLFSNQYLSLKNESELATFLYSANIKVFFFNSGHWIEEFIPLRLKFPNIQMIMRSGGNEIIQAPLTDMSRSLQQRQRFWVQAINTALNFLIVNSAFSIRRMVEIGIKKEKMILVRGGVDLKQCNANVINYSQNRSEFDALHNTQGTILLGIVSRFEKFKCISEVLAILARNQQYNWHLVIAGEGREQQTIERYLKDNIDPDKYTYMGKIDNDQALKTISILDYLINCSCEYPKKSGSDTYIHTETMGRSMIEAICQRTPLIATNSGGTRELFIENTDIGFLFNSLQEFENNIASILSNPLWRNDRLTTWQYDWEGIFKNIYLPMMNLKKIGSPANILVLDIDDTVTHSFLSAEQNQENIENFLTLYSSAVTDINTADDYNSILKRFPVIKLVKNKICIIADCGQSVYVYGQPCVFLQNYAKYLFTPGQRLIKKIEAFFERENVRWLSKKYVNHLYLNYKTTDVSSQTMEKLKKELEDSGFTAYANHSNVKIISTEINKGSVLSFLLEHILCPRKIVGAGNNILDENFLEFCDTAFMVNNTAASLKIKPISIKSQADVDFFQKVLENEII